MKQSQKNTPVSLVSEVRTKDTSGLSFGAGYKPASVVKVSIKGDKRTTDASQLSFGGGHLPAAVIRK